MLGLSVGDWLVLFLTSFFSGALLNQWIFKKFHNHSILKLAVSSALIILIAILNLAAAGQEVHKILAFYLFIICGGMVLGAGLDSNLDGLFTLLVKRLSGKHDKTSK